jgi:integrase/recombinase XerD
MATELRRKPPVPIIKCLAEAQWPDIDRAAWNNAHRRVSLLDDGGLALKWSPGTRSSMARGYGGWLGFLLSRNMLHTCEGIPARITRERVEAYLYELRAAGYASSTIHIRLVQLCGMQDVLAPGTREDWLGRLRAKARAAVQPIRDDRTRLPPADRLVEIGLSLMRRADDRAKRSPRLGAVAYRDGLMLMVLLASGLRVGNFANLRVGYSLVERSDGWWIAFEARETKNRRPCNLPLPKELAPMIDRYLEVWRPILLQRPGELHGRGNADKGLLWLGRYGGAFGPKQIAKRIGEITLRTLGHATNPHLFRKLIPTELAIHDAAHVGIAQAIPGHASYDTTQRYYNLGRSIDAARRVQVAMADLRHSKPGT